VDDKTNFELFTLAVDQVASSSDRFPDIINDYDGVWAPVNVNEIGSAPPDRTQAGNQVNAVQAFSGLDQFDAFDELDLVRFVLFLNEARLFMNLCADLQQLATLAGDTDSSSQFADLVKLVTNIGTSDVTAFPLEFLNAVLLALRRRMDATPTSLSAPVTPDGAAFNVTVLYS